MEERKGKTGIAVAEILEGELYGVLLKARGEAKPLGEPELFRKLRAAEDFYERTLQVRFGEQRIASEPEKRGLNPDTYDVAETAYDYPPDFQTEERWGFLQLRARPVKEVTKYFFTYPGMGWQPAYDVNPDWVRLLDRKSGITRLVPGSGEITTFAFSSFIHSVLSASRGVPSSIFVDYVAGLSRDEIAKNHNDLLEGIRLRTALSTFGILTNVRTGGTGSQSLSQDGQSRSQGFAGGKYGAYSGFITLAMEQEEAILESWKTHERGIPMVVC